MPDVLAGFAEILSPPGNGRPAIGAFTCYGLEAAAGVIQAAERRDAPVVLLISAQAFRSPIGRHLVRALRAIAEAAAIPVTLQLDHVSDLGLIEAALDEGVLAVMADGSQLPYDQNVELVRSARKLAKGYGAQVEAELGHVGGNEERAVAATASGYTDPDQAADFVIATGASCLAVSIGNVHGAYAEPPSLDMPRLEEIRDRVGDVPLSLHGASGLPNEQLAAAVRTAIAKVNVNTELRKRYLDVLVDRLPATRAGLDLLSLTSELVSGTAEVVGDKLDQFALMSGTDDVK